MIRAFLARLFGFEPIEPPTATSSPTPDPAIVATFVSTAPNVEDTAGGKLTRCPEHGRRYMAGCGFNEHACHKDEFHHFNVSFLRCTVRGCKTVVPDFTGYYDKVHPEQLEGDQAFARECGGELWLPDYLRKPEGQVGEGYREQAPEDRPEINPRTGRPYPDPPPRPGPGQPNVPVRE